MGCLDQNTADFVKKIASQFKIGEKKFRGYSSSEFGDISFKFSGNLPGKEKDPNETLNWIFKLNNIDGKFKIIERTQTSNGFQVIFETNKKTAAFIKERGCILRAGIKKIKLIPCDE